MITGEIGNEDVARAVAAAGYRRGAKFVDVDYFDPHVKRARIEYADPDSLDFVPRWYGTRMVEHAEDEGARVTLATLTAPNLLDDLDKKLVGRDMLPRVKELTKIVGDRSTNWCIVPGAAPRVGRARVSRPRRGRGVRAALGRARACAAARRRRRRGRVGRAHGGAARRSRAADGARVRRDRAARARERSCRSACCRRTVGGRPTSRAPTVCATFRICRPKRSSRRPTRCGRAGTSRRRSRLRCATARSSAGFACASRTASPWRSTPRRTPTRSSRCSTIDEGALRLGELALVDRQGPHRPARHRLLQHAARRERGQPHRARRGLQVPGRRGRRAARQREQPAHRLHDRLERGRRGRRSRPTASAFPCSAAATGRSRRHDGSTGGRIAESVPCTRFADDRPGRHPEGGAPDDHDAAARAPWIFRRTGSTRRSRLSKSLDRAALFARARPRRWAPRRRRLRSSSTPASSPDARRRTSSSSTSRRPPIASGGAR